MASTRLIRLRRPPAIRAVAEPFVPGGMGLDEVDRRWAALCAANQAFHDGRLLHVFGVHRNGHGGATIHVAECAYRFHAVSIDGPDTGVRPLGVKGIVTATKAGADDDHGAVVDVVLMGRRSSRVGAYRGCWEFAPGGGVEPGATPEATFECELREETGLLLDGGAGAPDDPTARVAPRPSCHAILFDSAVRSWEIVMSLRLEQPRDLPERTVEYDALRWVPRTALPAGDEAGGDASRLDAPLTPAAVAMMPLLATSIGGSTTTSTAGSLRARSNR